MVLALVYNGPESGQNGPGNIAQMLKYFGYTVRFIQKITKETLGNEKLCFLPGGSGGYYYVKTKAINWDDLKAWIKAGGHFCGVCAGGYAIVNNVKDYNYGMKIIDSVIAYPISYTAPIDIIFEGKTLPIYLYNGGSYEKINGDPHVIATYKTLKRMAVVGDVYGKGRAVACAPHPEVNPKRYEVFKAILEYLNSGGGEVSNEVIISFDKILEASKRVTEFIQDNLRQPNYITINNTKLDVESFNYLLLNAVTSLANNQKPGITVKQIGKATKQVTPVTKNKLVKDEYVKVAGAILDFMKKNNRMPNYAETSIGLINTFNVIDMYSRVLNFYYDKKALPNYVNAASIGTNPIIVQVTGTLKEYLEPTNNCQVNDPYIIQLAKNLDNNGPKIFEYLRDHFRYNYYYNTRDGAVKALHVFNNNCVDQTHALIALLRASKIPARYRHIYGRFSDGKVYGHVHAQAWDGAKWVNLDTISKNNRWDIIINWTLEDEINIYKELPF